MTERPSVSTDHRGLTFGGLSVRSPDDSGDIEVKGRQRRTIFVVVRKHFPLVSLLPPPPPPLVAYLITYLISQVPQRSGEPYCLFTRVNVPGSGPGPGAGPGQETGRDQGFCRMETTERGDGEERGWWSYSRPCVQGPGGPVLFGQVSSIRSRRPPTFP